ncbi:hypothetical protein N7U66_13705 [Lacinutrix neustonica]|uniref:STAS/SEC14 domain-containing protein n=1 Tax=Lacinutrix neustonica TaxID=2980107 RepID=A0A9E8MVS1_9FLAO|nr:hypothetical protein [Lacinutrix neustonica]WAC01185.1 hypothetical protein N7U66_13705 [Lacinutrix neustonica]
MSQALENYKLIKSYTFNFGKVDFYENFLITEISEGFCFDIDDALKVSELVTLHFQDKPFAYISNRVHSYSLIPMNYLKIKEVFPTIAAFAAVTYTVLQESMIDVENTFLDGFLKNFNSVDQAVSWCQSKL